MTIGRLPIRIRLTLAFAVAMALVLAATGTFLRVRLEASLEESLERDLRTRANDVALLIRARGGEVEELPGRNDIFVQVADERGRVLEATARDVEQAVLTRAELERALRGNVLVEHERVAGLEDAILFARSVRAGGRRLVVVAGASAEEREEAVESLFRLLLVGGPAALLLASAAGYLLAASALRPVGDMRRRAAEISASTPGERLPLPAATDEIHELGTTLNEMLARLEATLERERRLISDASHELRTPLATLKTEIELALRQPRSRQELEQALRSAAAETNRLVRLAEDLLVLARADDEAERPAHVETRVADLFEAVASSFAGWSGAAGRAIEHQCPADLVVEGDRAQLERALANLVANALRHGAGTVSLDAVEQGEVVELHVSDEGEGIPAPFLPRAFERFSRADEARARGGAGLGLAIVDVVARGHGGRAGATNSTRGGADVWIELPRIREDGTSCALPKRSDAL